MGQFKYKKLITIEIRMEDNEDISVRVAHNAEDMPRKVRKKVSDILCGMGEDIYKDIFAVDGKDVVIPCPSE